MIVADEFVGTAISALQPVSWQNIQLPSANGPRPWQSNALPFGKSNTFNAGGRETPIMKATSAQ